MELVKKEKKTFPVAYRDHLSVLNQLELVNGHLEVLLHALQGMTQGREGEAIGHLKALESVASNARVSLLEMEGMIQDLRPEKDA